MPSISQLKPSYTTLYVSYTSSRYRMRILARRRLCSPPRPWQGNADRDTRTDQPASAGTWLACFESAVLQGKPSIKPVSMIVSARAHAHYPPRRKERELVRLRRFSFLRDLILLAWLVAAGVIAARGSQSSTLRRGALREEPGLTAVAFSLSIRSHLHLGFAFRPSEHLLAQAVHQVAPAGRAANAQGLESLLIAHLRGFHKRTEVEAPGRPPHDGVTLPLRRD